MLDAAFFHGPVGILSWFAIMLAAGRTVLAWLPPGPVGGHALRDLPVTAATSYLIGVVTWSAIDALPTALRIAACVAVSVLAVVRLATAPAAMVPRHEPPIVRASWLSHGIVFVAWVVIAWVVRAFALEERGGDPLAVAVFAASLAAVAILVEHALDVARCPPWVRAAGVLFYALVLLVEPAPHVRALASCAPMLFAAGALSAIAWFRRADRRALATAVIFVCGAWLVTPGGWIMAASGVLWLVIGTPSASRARVAAWCAVGLGAAGALRSFGAVASDPEPELPWAPALSSVVTGLFVLIAAARWHDLRQAHRRAWNPSGAPIGHEDAMLLRSVLTVLLLSMMVRSFQPRWPASDPFRPSLFVLAVLAGLALRRFAPAERTRVPA
jgi:hypothetical protein